VHWLIRGTDNHRMGSRSRLKPTDARNLPKTFKVAPRKKDKFANGSDELLKWITGLNRGRRSNLLRKVRNCRRLRELCKDKCVVIFTG
jgi:hypothetical protein